MGLETLPDLYFHTPKNIFISKKDKDLHQWFTMNCSLMDYNEWHHNHLQDWKTKYWQHLAGRGRHTSM
jgi:hypothetical protein